MRNAKEVFCQSKRASEGEGEREANVWRVNKAWEMMGGEFSIMDITSSKTKQVYVERPRLCERKIEGK